MQSPITLASLLDLNAQLRHEKDMLLYETVKLKNSINEMNGKFDVRLLNFKCRKLYFESTPKSQRDKVTQIKKVFVVINKHLSSLGLNLTEVKLREISEQNPNIKISISQNDNDDMVSANGHMSPDIVLKFKDKSNMSDKLYHEMIRSLNLKRQLPNIHIIKTLRQQLDKRTTVFENRLGVYVDAKEKIKLVLERFYTTHRHTFRGLNGVIRLKLSGDGTCVGRILKLFNFTFTLIDFEKAQTATGNYTLGIFEIKDESYTELKECLGELLSSLCTLDGVQLGDETFKIVKYLGGDLKFLANVLGVNGNFNSSTYPCLWCKCPKADFVKYNQQEWSIVDGRRGARTLEESHTRPSLKCPKDREGYTKQPIIDFIPFGNVIIDLLHLFLRMSDVLLELLLKELDGLGYGTDVKDKQKRAVFMDFYNYLENTCKVKKPFTSNGLRSLGGQERVNIFAKIDLARLFPFVDQIDEKDLLWSDFYAIYVLIRDDKLNSREIQTHTARFTDEFLAVYPHRTLTPYQHCFVAHLHEFRTVHGDFNLFNQQGLEKLNDITTQQYFKSTNKSGNCLMQLLKKRNRIEFYH